MLLRRILFALLTPLAVFLAEAGKIPGFAVPIQKYFRAVERSLARAGDGAPRGSDHGVPEVGGFAKPLSAKHAEAWRKQKIDPAQARAREAARARSRSRCRASSC